MEQRKTLPHAELLSIVDGILDAKKCFQLDSGDKASIRATLLGISRGIEIFQLFNVLTSHTQEWNKILYDKNSTLDGDELYYRLSGFLRENGLDERTRKTLNDCLLTTERAQIEAECTRFDHASRIIYFWALESCEMNLVDSQSVETV